MTPAGITPSATSPRGARGRPSATDLAYEVLRRRILLCEMAPGAELREAEIAAQLGVGRTPVREALGRLVHDGLVDVRPRQGYRVTEVTVAAIHEVFEVRSLVEPAAVGLAAARVDRVDRASVNTLADFARSSRPSSFAGFVAYDYGLHLGLARLAGNQRLARLVAHSLADMQRVLVLSLGASGVRGLPHRHSDLVDAIVAGDAAGASAVLLDEIETHRTRVVEALAGRMPSATGERGISAERRPRRPHATSRTPATPGGRVPPTGSGAVQQRSGSSARVSRR